MKESDLQRNIEVGQHSLSHEWIEACLSYFMNDAHAEQIDFIEHILECLRAILKADRGYIIEFSQQYDRYEQTYEVLKEGIISRIAEFKSRDNKPFVSIIEQLKNRQPLVINDLQEAGEFQELMRYGLGKTKTRSVLLCGLFDRHQVFVGILGISLDNPYIWSTQEIDLILRAARMISVRLELKYEQKSLVEYRQFQTLVLEISSQFVNQSNTQTNQLIMNSLQRLAKFMQMQKACLFLVHRDNPQLWSMTHEWTEELPIRWHDFQDVVIPRHEKIVEDLYQMRTIEIGDIEYCPDQYSVMKDILKISGVRSLLEIPISYQNKFVGFIGLTGIEPRRKYSDSDIALIKFAGELFYQGILSKSTQDEIQEQNRKLHDQQIFDQLITSISSSLINVECEQIEEMLQTCSIQIAQLLNAKVIMICEFMNDLKDTRYITRVNQEGELLLPQRVIEKIPHSISKMQMQWLWAECVQGRQMFFESLEDFPSEAIMERKLLKEAGEESLACLPLNVGNELLGTYFLSFENKNSWNDELKHKLLNIAQITANALHRLRTETELRYRNDIEQLINRITTRFINIPFEEINLEIHESLKQIGQILKVDRTFVYELMNDDELVIRDYWIDERYAPDRPPPEKLNSAGSELLLEKLKQGQAFNFPDVNQIPDMAAKVREMFQQLGVKSVVFFPIFSHKKLKGLWGFSTLGNYRTFNEQDLIVLSVFANALSNTLERQEDEQQQLKLIEKIEAQNRELTNNRNFDQLLTFISTRFINTEFDEIDNLLNECSLSIAQLLDAGSIMICEFINNNQEAKFISCVRLNPEIFIEPWIMNGVPKPISEMKMKWTWEQLLLGKRMIFKDPNDFPFQATEERRISINQHERSIAYFPLTVGNDVLGYYFIAFSHIQKWDDELIQKFTVIAQITANAIHRRRTEKHLVYVNQIEQLISRLSSSFINLPSEKMAAGIDHALAEIGQLLNVDRTYMYEFSEDEVWLKLTHYWLAEGIPLEQKPNPMIDMRQMFWAHQQMKEGNYLNLSNINNIPDMAYQLRQMYQKLGVKSTAFFPIFTHQKLRALWGISSLRTYREFKDQDLTVLKIFATTLANAMERFEDDLEQKELYKELEKKNQELESFTYTVSHDLKSPIISINGFVGALKEDLKSQDEEAINDDLQEIEKAAARMKQLLDELLTLSRIGRIINQSAVVCSREMVSEIAHSLKPLIEENKVQMIIHPELPKIYGDPVRLVEVFQNLIINAIKFNDKSLPVIEIGMEKDARDRKLVYVKDNGTGIDPKYHQKIFGLFERLDAKGEGTGIGLAIVKKIVEYHHGEIWVESDGRGNGSTFYIYLPDPPETFN